eukprot:Phypoly_transcript_09422.p2 GENE.Phypoly_transcript_09422~~Phypoly_transcript_09422.p2  ORF type:complete len:195 (+),score=34.96 Phypoly_transcript_09422:619-1203(+)
MLWPNLRNLLWRILWANLAKCFAQTQLYFEGACSTSYFAIISDPRYLDEVKHRRANERHEPLSDDDYHPTRRIKRRKLEAPSNSKLLAVPEEPTSPSFHPELTPRVEDTSSPNEDMPISPLSPSSPWSCTSPSAPSSPASPCILPPPSHALQALKECADYELVEEEKKLIKLVEALKHKGCNFDILPPRSHRVA